MSAEPEVVLLAAGLSAADVSLALHLPESDFEAAGGVAWDSCERASTRALMVTSRHPRHDCVVPRRRLGLGDLSDPGAGAPTWSTRRDATISKQKGVVVTTGGGFGCERLEVVHEGAQSLVFRGVRPVDGPKVLVKTSAERNAAERGRALQREWELLAGLRGVEASSRRTDSSEGNRWGS